MKPITKHILPVTIFFCITALTNASNTLPAGDTALQGDDIQVMANNDFISIYENTSWAANVTNNDYGLQSGIREISISTPPENGSAKVLPDNSILYTPNQSFTGSDLFIYRVCNSKGNCDEAEVNISVADYNYSPELYDDHVIYYSDSSSVFKVLINDKELFDIPLEMSILKDLTNGYAEITDEMSIKLNFTSYFIQTDSLVYQICDKEGDCGQATLYVTPYKDATAPGVIPEAFSPNGDGYNDTFWIPEYDYYRHLSFMVFNRNGIKVYESQDYQNKWDGIANTGPLNGILVPKGIYFYVLTITGSSEEKKGSIYVSY
ncbi:gliding motility-associated C-terminal domain-containing protein [Marinilabilia sp.]|uniref:T9SS type B sorting domain-containing protein n=1 Tax=Marinilabilia sp. TaxID=2021252 RepID=UPI0025C1C6B1|nr:gliding motility-associated C-terminal domain-containing protein [Marinilabilia sp.]